MSRSLQFVVVALLTAVIGLGNCAMCLGLAAATEAGRHACCRRDAQPPCHTNQNAPEPRQDDCSSRLEALKSAQASEKMLYTPVLASAPAADLFSAVAGARGRRLIPDQAAAASNRPPQSPTPLRI